MKRLVAASAAFLALTACQPKTEPAPTPEAAAHDQAPLIPEESGPLAPATQSVPDNIDPETRALAGAWLLTAAAAPDKACRITLVAADVDPSLRVTRLASLEPACIEAVPITAKIMQWAGSGDGGIFLIGGEGATNIIELQPTDPAGVFAGTDAGGVRYEMRPAS